MTMNPVPIARLLGWGSLGFAVASLAAPRLVAHLSGFRDRPELARTLGVRDLVVGAGLVGATDVRPWMYARLASEVMDTAMMAEGSRRGAFDRRRSLPGAAFALFCAGVEIAVIRQLANEPGG
jgi:hypothetical protein